MLQHLSSLQHLTPEVYWYHAALETVESDSLKPFIGGKKSSLLH